MAKKRKRHHHTFDDIDVMCHALDSMLSGAQSVIGPDFILTQQPLSPKNADIGHLDRKALRTFDQTFIDTLIHLTPKNPIVIPKNLKQLGEYYKERRKQLSNYHESIFPIIEEYDIVASKELGNFDPYIDKVVIRNDAELNVFYDYILLYRYISKQRAIHHWQSSHTHDIYPTNKVVAKALADAKFSVLRLDANLDHGAIQATNIITQESIILIDRALNASHKEGCFFICSLLDMGGYFMTSGGGIPLDPYSDAGKSALSLIKKHLIVLRRAKRPLTQGINACVREVYGFCLRGSALEGMRIK